MSEASTDKKNKVSTDKKTTQNKAGFACAEEAAALLNCVADKKYNDMRCIPLMKKLRACIEKKVKKMHSATSACWLG